ncbi:MAG: hypothetical protein ABIQ12_01215 [Opitutaceae bacterium]
MSFAPAERRQLAWITAGAIVVFVTLRVLPTGTNLSHMDFRVDPRGGNSIEFCDPLNPQFIPVVAARSPVAMTLSTATSPRVGVATRATLTLKTAGGKSVAVADLLETHTRRLHLLLIDPTLADYQHVHPEPNGEPGGWSFTFTPRRAGAYRVFADFTPAATARGLYASVDLEVAAGVERNTGEIGTGRSGFTFALVPASRPPRVGQPIDLRFAISRPDGAAIPLEPVMGAYAHLVAFDATRSGFAHLHPTEADLLKKPDATQPALNFKLTIPRAGRYTIWAQVNIGGSETFVPFELEVVE